MKSIDKDRLAVTLLFVSSFLMFSFFLPSFMIFCFFLFSWLFSFSFFLSFLYFFLLSFSISCIFHFYFISFYYYYRCRKGGSGSITATCVNDAIQKIVPPLSLSRSLTHTHTPTIDASSLEQKSHWTLLFIGHKLPANSRRGVSQFKLNIGRTFFVSSRSRRLPSVRFF